MAISTDDRLQARNDLAWSISVGGIGIVLFIALLVFAWYFAATLFLIFAGILLGVALNAMTDLLGRVVPLPQPLRLAIVCLALAAMLSGICFLGGTTIAQQATVLSNTIKSQLVERQDVPRKPRRRYQLLRSRLLRATPAGSDTPTTPATPPTPHNLPSASTIASSGGAILGQTFKVLLGTVSAVGNFFIVLFLGLAFAVQPERLPRRPVVHGAGQAPCARHRHHRPHRLHAGALADRADHHHGRGVPRHLDRPCRSSAFRARSSWASRPGCSPSFRPSAPSSAG